jgi:hypothetical protein
MLHFSGLGQGGNKKYIYYLLTVNVKALHLAGLELHVVHLEPFWQVK